MIRPVNISVTSRLPLAGCFAILVGDTKVLETRVGAFGKSNR